MRFSGVRGLLNGDRWSDDVRLPDLEPLFTCRECGHRGMADSQMTDHPPDLPRYLIRIGLRGWMVWDRHSKGPAKFQGRRAIVLTEERAREIKEELTAGANRILGHGR
jgi:hypothetical protein